MEGHCFPNTPQNSQRRTLSEVLDGSRSSCRIAAAEMNQKRTGAENTLRRKIFSSAIEIPLNPITAENTRLPPHFASEPVITHTALNTADVIIDMENTDSTKSSQNGTNHVCSGRFAGMFRVWENNFTMKIFGSRNGIKREEQRRQNLKYFIIHPCSKFRIYWDLSIFFILVVNVLLLPVAIAFFSGSNIGWLVFNALSDFIFLTDIVLNFWTGIIYDDMYVLLELREIRRYYVKHWLALDILSVFPLDYILQGVFQTDYFLMSHALRLLRLVKLISLLRLCRVIRFIHYLSKWEELINATKSITPVIKFVIAVLLLAHWNACIQFLVPYLQDFPEDSWVSINRLQNASVATQYSWGLFKAFSHMLCIGFGRWPPQNVTEVWVTIVSMLIGASLYAMFIGHISNLIHSVTTASRSYNEKLKQVEEYMRYRKLPQDMKERVYEYYYQRYHGQLFDEEAILAELSEALREDVIQHNCNELIQVVPFFLNAEEAFISSLLTRLKFEVFLPNEIIIHFGVVGSKMYFIQHGTVDILNSEGDIIKSLSDGAYFGEIGLLIGIRRVAGVRATSVCDLYSLTKEDLHIILEEFPHMRIILETVAIERLKEINHHRTFTEPSTSQVSNEYVSEPHNIIHSTSNDALDPGEMV